MTYPCCMLNVGSIPGEKKEKNGFGRELTRCKQTTRRPLLI